MVVFFCTDCGKAVNTSMKFCGNCGAALHPPTDPAVPTPSPESRPVAVSSVSEVLPAGGVTSAQTPETALRQAADQGDADAQFNLGVAYRTGRGVPQDGVEAVAWWRKAAEKGLASAQFNLGYAYAQGQGVPQDDAQAMSWYLQSAEQGNADAQFNLGETYAKGWGVPQDDAQALAWYRKAAERGNVRARLAVEPLAPTPSPDVPVAVEALVPTPGRAAEVWEAVPKAPSTSADRIMPPTQTVVVKHGSSGCMTCLVILLILFVGIPVLIYGVEIAIIVGIIGAIFAAIVALLES